MAGTFFRRAPVGDKIVEETPQSKLADLLLSYGGDRKRLGIFVDGANLYSTMRKLRWDMDYYKLFRLFNSIGDVIYAGYYTAVLEDPQENKIQGLLDFLAYHNWTVVTKPARQYTSDEGVKWTKGNMDMEFAMDCLIHAKHIDHMILGTGDGDFRVLVYELQRMGVTVSVLSSKERPQGGSPICSDDLRRQANTFIEVNDFREMLLKKR